jgi:hypothetical protein
VQSHDQRVPQGTQGNDWCDESGQRRAKRGFEAHELPQAHPSDPESLQSPDGQRGYRDCRLTPEGSHDRRAAEGTLPASARLMPDAPSTLSPLEVSMPRPSLLSTATFALG